MKTKSQKPAFSLHLVFNAVITVNLLILNCLIFRLLTQQPQVLGQSDSAQCPQSCISYIDRRTGASISSAKEYFVPLGTGAVTSRDWTDVAGAESTINSSSYNRIKEVILEATVSVPTGNQTVWVRLYNVTDAHPVWFSELSMSGSGPTLLISPAITLDRGTKTYVVQMKTQLGYTANLTQSRVKITTR